MSIMALMSPLLVISPRELSKGRCSIDPGLAHAVAWLQKPFSAASASENQGRRGFSALK